MTARYNKGKLNISMNNAYFSADTMVMWLIPIIFAALTLWFFPLTAALSYDGRWRVFWLPRVWCGFAAPRELRFGNKRRRSAPKLPPLFYITLGSELLSRLQTGCFAFCLRTGCVRSYCIVGVTVGYIILSTARAALICVGRRKRRGLLLLNGR